MICDRQSTDNSSKGIALLILPGRVEGVQA